MASPDLSGDKLRGQTAISGVISVFSVNLTSRGVGYLRHILITAYIGLTVELDAFFAASSAVGIVVLVFGDIFDSIGVPRLVRARQQEGEEAFRRAAAQVVLVAAVLSLCLTGLLIFLAPATPYIVPGFSPHQKGVMVQYVYLLVPMTLVYLPYHAMGSILRSQRLFRAFYLAELVASVVTLVALALWHTDVKHVAIATSAGYVAAASYLYARVRPVLGWERPISEEGKRMFLMAFQLLPTYIVPQLYLLIDKTFASYLPAGSVSALSYGLMLTTALPSLLAVENVFVTPLAETENRWPIVSRIMTGILLVFVPVTVYVLRYSRDIISILFERGMFGASSVEMTTGALRFFILGLPAWAFWGTLCRLHQISEQFGRLFVISVIGLACHAGLNYLLGFHWGMGLRGLALATAIGSYIVVAMSLGHLRGLATRSDVPKLCLAATFVIVFSALSLLASEIIPKGGGLLTLSLNATVFAAVYWIAMTRLSNEWLRSAYNEIASHVRPSFLRRRPGRSA